MSSAAVSEETSIQIAPEYIVAHLVFVISGDGLKYMYEVNRWNMFFHSLEENCMK